MSTVLIFLFDQRSFIITGLLNSFKRVSVFFSRVHATLHPALLVRQSIGQSVHQSAGPSVGPSITLYFLSFFELFGLTATSNMAPAHRHATGVAVYPALFYLKFIFLELEKDPSSFSQVNLL